TLADIKMVFLPNPADHIPAFSTKGIDVSYMVEPFVTIAAAQSIGVPWLWLSELDPGNQGAVLVFGERLTKDVDAGRRFMVAYVKGLRDYNDAFFKGKNKAEIVQILIKYTALKDPALYDKVGMPGLHPDGKINIANVGVFQDFLIRKGALKERVDLNKVIDMQFADYAVQQLGPYK
ncbi:MAG: metal ABC transporter substrate-binding protein, partial [Dehalococcoidia bacterium]|nr:metal ABC transporter substrate-binding protein [Dehalococcoidia bacterium]